MTGACLILALAQPMKFITRHPLSCWNLEACLPCTQVILARYGKSQNRYDFLVNSGYQGGEKQSNKLHSFLLLLLILVFFFFEASLHKNLTAVHNLLKPISDLFLNPIALGGTHQRAKSPLHPRQWAFYGSNSRQIWERDTHIAQPPWLVPRKRSPLLRKILQE